MTSSLSQMPASGSADSARSQLDLRETRTFESQISVPKKQVTSIDHYFEVVRNFQGHIPCFQDAETNVQVYYQNALKNARGFKTAVEDGDIAISKIDANFQELALQINKLFNLLNSYKSKCYQWKFKMDQFNIVFNNMKQIEKSLEVIEKELEQFEKGLKWFDGESEGHLGPEFTKEKILACLEPSEVEKRSLQLCQEESEKLAEKDREIHDRKLKFAESKKRVQEFEERLTKLKGLLNEKENFIEEKKKSFLISAEARQQFRMEMKDQMDSAFEETISKNKKGQEKAINFCDKRMDDIDKSLLDLVQKLAFYSTTSPFFHIIFVLDHSGSMAGSRWNAVLKALEVFVERNKNHSKNLISIILFDDTAVEVMKKVEISQYQTPQSSKWGGTNFDPAFEMALDFTNLSRTHCPVVVFLTDGDGTMEEAPRLLGEMSLLKNRGFMFFSVGVGDNYDIETLRTITSLANGGESYIDLKEDRIEFMHTANDGSVLDKIFTDISNAINGMSLKIKKTMEDLKREKKEVQEEAKHLSDFYSKMSEQELKDIQKKQQDLLDRKIRLFDLQDSEEKKQIALCQKDKDLLLKDIELCQNKIEEERRECTPGEIQKLSEERKNLEKAKNGSWEDNEAFSAEKKKNLSQLKEQGSIMKLPTYAQMVGFNEAKNDFQKVNFERKKYLGEMRIFVGSVRRTISNLKSELAIIDSDENELEGKGSLDVIFERFRQTVEIKENDDLNNIQRIACHILRIKEKDQAKMENLEFLLYCVHPRKLGDLSISNDSNQKLIIESLENKYELDIEDLNNKTTKLKEKLETTKTTLRNKTQEVKTLREEIEDLEYKEIPSKERLVRELKAEIKKYTRADEDNKENLRNPNQAKSDDDDEENENRLKQLKEDLLRAGKLFEDKKSTLTRSKKDVEYLENHINELESQKDKTNEEISEMKKKKDANEKTILRYYGLLRDDFETKLQKFVKETNLAEIENFQKNIAEGLLPLIEGFLSQM